MKGLLWSAVLLLTVLVAVAFAAYVQPSQALTGPALPAAGDQGMAGNAPAYLAGKLALTDAVTYFTYLPAVSYDFKFA